MPRFKSASLSIAAAVPFISTATAAPFVSDATAALFISDATAALFVSTITATVSNRLGSSVLLKSTVSYDVRLSGDSRKAMSSGSSAPRIPCRCSSVLLVPWCCGSYSWCVRSVTQGFVFVDPRRKPPPLPSKSFPFHFSTGASKTCAIDETRHCGEVLKLSPTCPARCADCSGSPPDAPPFSIVGRLDTTSDFPQPHTTVRWLVFGLLMITFWARLTMITADIISSRLSSGKHSSEMDMVSLILAKSQRISGGFIGPFELRIMIYLLVMKSFPLDSSGTSWLLVLPSSHKEWISYLLSMKGYTFSVLLLNSGFSFSTGMSSCVAVSTGPEEATEITFGFLVGESWLSTSHYVTIFQLVVKVLSTHSSFVSNSLSTFYEVDYRTQFKPNLSPDSKHFGSDNTVSLESVVFFVLHPTADRKNHVSFPHKLFPDEKKNIPCLIPCAIDQDPYFRLTRDVAPRLDFIKPALIESKFFPALRASEDIPFQYLSFFLEDDAELEHIKKEYGEGRMTTGDVKKRLVQVVTEIVERHRMARAAVTDEMVDAFMTPRPLFE
ncbi:hypothetical protein F2Q70_00037729 [Brassica cretica]|uniref:Tryptophanyl-tRNA synthetase n=1 Tax=Brassica cretica TaxID=69181 RepID=A0A8S9K006_BRACR|nr:hypothetical protein F2Q70_00037729 [Brassica cretica]